MATDTDTYDQLTACGHVWCQAHKPCSCVFSAIQPHLRVGCRYTTDDDGDQDDEQ